VIAWKIEENCCADFVSELKHATIVMRDLALNAATMLNVAIPLRPLQAAFPRVLKLFQIALTLPVSTASCQRSFSCIKRVKTYTRTTLTASRSCGLWLMSFKKKLSRDETMWWRYSKCRVILPGNQDEYQCESENSWTCKQGLNSAGPARDRDPSYASRSAT
jgi:hAT family C-terminal dimerisation region